MTCESKPTIHRVGIGPIASEAVVWKDTAYIAGQVAPGPSDVRGQTEEILARIDELLNTVESSRSQLLSATIWLADISTWSEMNEIWTRWIDPVNPPARVATEARLASNSYLVEISVVAAVDYSTSAPEPARSSGTRRT